MKQYKFVAAMSDDAPRLGR